MTRWTAALVRHPPSERFFLPDGSLESNLVGNRFLGPGGMGPAMKTPEPGMNAPSFQAQDQDGNTRSLSEFKGKNVVLFFYPEDDTSGCTKEACAFRDNIGRFEKANTVVLGVSTDGVESHQRFAEKYGLPVTLLADPEGEIVAAYNVENEAEGGRARRVTYLIGPDGEVLRVYQKVDPAVHAEELLQDLESPQTH